MRLWSWQLVANGLLPKSQLLSQKREIDLIWKDLANGKKTNHILINYIWEYEDYLSELYCYYLLLQDQFKKRGYKFNFSKNVFKLRAIYVLGADFVPFPNHHTDRYLLICFMNLFEKKINNQKDLTQPIYAIAKFYCGKFTGITGIYSLDGDNDYEEIKNNFLKNYAWKENQMGVMEQTYELIKIDICSILDYKGELV